MGATKGDPAKKTKIVSIGKIIVSPLVSNTWNCFLVEGDGNQVVDCFKRDETDGKASTSLRVDFGGNIPASSADGYFQVALTSLAGIHCKHIIRNKKVELSNQASLKMNL